MKTAIIILLVLLCAALINAISSLERSLRRGADQIRTRMEGRSAARLLVACPNAAAEELFRTTDELLELRQSELADARKKERELRRQIADVSHDLRTPLTSILGYLQLLEDADLSDAQRREYLSVIRGRADTLQTLITSFYDLSRVEGGQWQLEREPVDLARVVGDQLAAACETLEEAGMEVAVDIPDELPRVWGDRHAVVRVVSNLLTNALKHGAGHLDLRLYREGDHVTARFTNGAPGMTERDAEHVFERFYTADRTRSGQNTGLGLAIVKALAERMGGQASAALSDGDFTILLKLPAVQ